MRGLTFAVIGSVVGLIVAAVVGAGSLVAARGAAALTPSGFTAMLHRTQEVSIQYILAGMVLGAVASGIKPRDPEAEAINHLLMKGLGWHIGLPMAGFAFLYVITQENTTSMAFFLFAMLGSVTSFLERSHRSHHRLRWLEPPVDPEDGETSTLVWHPAWTSGDSPSAGTRSTRER